MVGTYIYKLGNPHALDVSGKLGVSGWLKDEGGNPLANKPVKLYVDGVYNRTVVTDAYGQFTALVYVGATDVNHLVEVRFEGDPIYAPCSGSFMTEKFEVKVREAGMGLPYYQPTYTYKTWKWRSKAR
jgi:hypothetical protein